MLKSKPLILEIEPYKPGLSKAKGEKQVIKLSSNETPLGASEKAVEAYISAAKNLYRYPDGSATVLREAIGQVHGIDPERIICGAGSDEIISFLCHAYAGAGDEVLYSEHGFLMYPIYAKIAGATPVKAKEKNLRVDVDSLLEKVNSNTKIVFVANPNNPTGSYVPGAELLRLRKGLPENVLLVIDAAYSEYVSNSDYSDGKELVDMGENTVMLRTFSKIYGLAALRIGWAYCPKNVADILNRVRGPFNVSMPAYLAAAAAVKDVEFIRRAKEHNDYWLPWLTKELSALGLKVHPSVANFILVEFLQGNKNADKANDYLMENGIIGRRVGNYGLDNFLRFTIGKDSENQALVKSLGAFLDL